MSKRKLAWVLLLVILLVTGLALAWRLTPLAELARPEQLAERLEAIQRWPAAPFLFIAMFVIGGLVVMPVLALIVAVGILFPPLMAFGISLTGVMLSAAVLHWIGGHFRGRLRAAIGPAIQRLDAVLTDRGILAVATIRMLPVAPFTVVNVAAGSIGVRFRDYMVGTALGMLPGIAVLSLFGSQVREFWKDPSPGGVIIALAIAASWIAVSLGLQKWAASR
jgi:phospholipase D1/2